ncbi:hypothetical protein BIY29_11850 [Brenneria alni]|uniref:TadE-like domain-containing protein n=1 Tax=Brenneria alni TaxID=71656 RepID=A0A421DMS0_9GAMM|nr:TadE/TadG family type IV pilus assembly protein [Brenneria alni]RLM22677.1 hypothetical protein BIY29_11850 [Brenneria alni]
MMKGTCSLRRRMAQSILWRVGRDSGGVMAVEAALILPVAVFLIFGALELYGYFRTSAVVERTAFMVANSLSMQRELNDSMGRECRLANDICTYRTIVSDLMTPLDYENHGGIIISLYTTSLDDSGDTVWKPKWQRLYKGSGNSPIPVSKLAPPADFPQAASIGDTTIVVETFYDYVPFVIGSTFWQKLSGERQISSRVFYRPRFSTLSDDLQNNVMAERL